MTQAQAERLADVVRAGFGPAVVEREGRFFVVAVETEGGRVLLRDEQDWRWLQDTL